jgi:hypothetical protein
VLNKKAADLISHLGGEIDGLWFSGYRHVTFARRDDRERRWRKFRRWAEKNRLAITGEGWWSAFVKLEGRLYEPEGKA